MTESKKTKKLTRSRDNRWIGGVAAGIGRYLNVDPTIVRIAFVASLIFGGIGVLAYLVLLAVVPIEGDPNEPAPQPDGSKRLWVIGGTVGIGILALVSIGITGAGFGGWMFGFAQGFWFGALIWILAIIGVSWLIRQSKDDEDTAPKAPAAASPQGTSASTVAQTIAPAPTQNAPGPPAAPRSPGVAAAGEAPTTETSRTTETQTMGAAPGPAPASPPSSVPSTFGKVMTILAIIAAAIVGAVILAVISASSTAVAGAIPMATVVILLGIGLVVAVLNNRHTLALWVLGAAVAVAVPMAVISIVDLRIDGEYGEVREKPVLAGSIPDDGYRLAGGAMTIDLREYPFRPGETVDLPIKSGIGASRVIVPDDVCVSGSVDGKFGLAEVRGHESSGAGFDQTFGTGDGGSPGLNLDSEVKLGLFLVMDATTWRESGPRGVRKDDWGGTMGFPNLQDRARNRALKACDGSVPRPAPDKPQVPSAPSKPKLPVPPPKPDVPSSPPAKSAA